MVHWVHGIVFTLAGGGIPFVVIGLHNDMVNHDTTASTGPIDIKRMIMTKRKYHVRVFEQIWQFPSISRARVGRAIIIS